MNQKIFLQISSWRDPFIVNTVRSAYENAYHPEQIIFGCVFQGYEEDMWMIDGLLDISNNIKLTYINAEDAPISITKIRGDIGTAAMTDEEYYMQVDSHTQFKKDWDVYLKAELKIANDHFGKSVITSQVGDFYDWGIPFFGLKKVSIPNEEMFKNISAPVVGKVVYMNNKEQINQSFICANCIFAYSDYIREIPQPDNVVFQYEQPMLAIRSFTGGYNIVSSADVYVAGFNYDEKNIPGRVDFVRNRRPEDPKWISRWSEAEKLNKKYYENILKNRIIDFKNGLLDKRTLEDFINFSKYDPLTLEVFLQSDEDYFNNKRFEVDEKILNKHVEHFKEKNV
jgi:hypothetical protein